MIAANNKSTFPAQDTVGASADCDHNSDGVSSFNDMKTPKAKKHLRAFVIQSQDRTEHTPGPWNVMIGKTLIHIETDAENPVGAGIPICSLPKKSQNADIIAAAPELLRNLTNAIKFMQYHYPEDARAMNFCAMLQTGVGIKL